MLFIQPPIQRKFRHVVRPGCSRLCPNEALKTSQDQGRHHFTELSWSTKAFSPSLVFSSFCHELLWSAWLCLFSPPSHWCQGCYWLPLKLFLLPAEPVLVTTASLQRARAQPHYLNDLCWIQSLWSVSLPTQGSKIGHVNMRSKECWAEVDKSHPNRALSHIPGQCLPGPMAIPTELLPSISCKGWAKTRHLSLLKFLRFPSPCSSPPRRGQPCRQVHILPLTQEQGEKQCWKPCSRGGKWHLPLHLTALRLLFIKGNQVGQA